MAPARYTPYIMANFMVLMDEIARMEMHRSGIGPTVHNPPIDPARIDEQNDGTIVITLRIQP